MRHIVDGGGRYHVPGRDLDCIAQTGHPHDAFGCWVRP